MTESTTHLPVERSTYWWFALLAATAVLLAGLMVLIGGWVLGFQTLRRVTPNSAAMAPSTSLCFVVTGTALLTVGVARCSSVARSRSILAAAAFIVLVSGLNLGIALSGQVRSIDALVMVALDEYHRASMAPATSFSFLLLAPCLASLARYRPNGDHWFVPVATVGLLIALVALAGYAFDSEALYALSIFAAMALHTALCFAGAFFAVLLFRAQRGWVGILVQQGVGSAGARRLFPIVVAVPLVLCLIALIATHSGLVQANFVLAVLAIVIIVLLATAVLHNAVIENRAERRLIALSDTLRATVAERDLLLSEVYHRVKNNLQQISALLQIESRQISDPAAREAFRVTAGRVHSMGTIHQMLISTHDSSSLKASQFLQSLCDNIVRQGRGTANEPSLRLEIADVPIPIDAAISIGLLVNECVSNAVKHAFPGRSDALITVRLQQLDDRSVMLAVEDNGIGMPTAQSHREATRRAGTGSLIIRGVVDQFNATMTINDDDGTSVRIVFPAKLLEERTHV